jgi:hypothetical protein
MSDTGLAHQFNRSRNAEPRDRPPVRITNRWPSADGSKCQTIRDGSLERPPKSRLGWWEVKSFVPALILARIRA